MACRLLASPTAMPVLAAGGTFFNVLQSQPHHTLNTHTRVSAACAAPVSRASTVTADISTG